MKSRSRNWRDAALTVIIIAVAFLVLLPLFRWAFIDAVWGTLPEAACRVRQGACWPVIAEKGLLILFGRYPASEVWRPIIATVALLGTAIITCIPRFRSNSLLLAWIAASIIFFGLMHGGLFGLTPVSWDQWGGIPVTIMLAVFGIALAFPLGIMLACARRSSKPAISWLATTYIEIIRGVPLITLLFMATFMFPLLVPENWSGNAIIRAQMAIILFAAAYLAEVVRGGLQYVSKGQFEASTALGMSRGEAYRYVVLPQALSLVIAPTVNTFITLLKDTSLVAIVSISELLLSARQSLADPVWRTHFVEVYLFIGVLYFVLCFSMAKWSKHLENKAVLATAHR